VTRSALPTTVAPPVGFGEPREEIDHLNAVLDALPKATKNTFATDAAMERHRAFQAQVHDLYLDSFTWTDHEQIERMYRLRERVSHTAWNRWNRPGDAGLETV
jgi:hypothetical protein